MENLPTLTTNLLLQERVVCILVTMFCTTADWCNVHHYILLFNLHCPKMRATALQNEMLDGGADLGSTTQDSLSG